VEVGDMYGKKAPKDRAQINGVITNKIGELTRYALTDSFCGFKAYRVSALKKLTLDEERYGMPLQLWMQAHKHQLIVKEIAVPRIYLHLDRSFGPDLDDKGGVIFSDYGREYPTGLYLLGNKCSGKSLVDALEEHKDAVLNRAIRVVKA